MADGDPGACRASRADPRRVQQLLCELWNDERARNGGLAGPALGSQRAGGHPDGRAADGPYALIAHRRKPRHADLEDVTHMDFNVLAKCVHSASERIALNDTFPSGFGATQRKAIFRHGVVTSLASPSCTPSQTRRCTAPDRSAVGTAWAVLLGS